MSAKIRIAIVGAGRTGAPLIQRMLDLDYVELVGVADRNLDSPGMLIARERGVFCVEHPDVLAAKGEDIDAIIDVTGDPGLKPALREAFIAQNNRSTVIVNDLLARFILSLATDSPELVETYHPHDRGLG